MKLQILKLMGKVHADFFRLPYSVKFQSEKVGIITYAFTEIGPLSNYNLLMFTYSHN